MDDSLPEALDSLMSREKQAEYMLSEVGLDAMGWIIYRLEYEGNELVTES